jgi:hypothetical protein
MYFRRWMLLSIAILLSTAMLYSVESSDKTPWQVNVTLVSEAGLPTPRPIADIFIVLNDSSPNEVYRVELNQTKDPTILAKEVYAAANATPHDPYKLSPNTLGPYPKDKALGFTLGQWLAAIGKGTYIEENNNATLNLTFHDLVPNGTYSVLYSRITMPPNFSDLHIPGGAPNGSQSVFRADAKGDAAFNLKMKALPDSTNVTFKDYVAMYVSKKAPITSNITWTLLGVAYHSDGKSHGAELGELGKTSHMQLVNIMYPKPARSFEEWKNASAIAATTIANTAQAKNDTL